MSTSIHSIPPEIFRDILSYVSPVDYIKVKLVSKIFSDWASREFSWGTMTKSDVIRGHTSLEAGFPRKRHLQDFICTHCGRVERKNQFSDNQAVKTNPKRICISCGISSKIYTIGQMPKISGEERIPCWRCKRAVPKYENWEAELASGKAVLAWILEESRARGFPERYIVRDGRCLDYSYQLQVLAFCKLCLELMVRHEEAAPMLSR